MRRTLLIFVAFAAGLLSGLWWAKPAAEVGESTNAEATEMHPDQGRGESAVLDAKETADQFKDSSREREDKVPPPTVEVIVDDSPAPASEISAAHAARRAKRQEARAAREKERHDFLSALNLDLLTDEQRKRHVLYVEANETSNALRKEISALRAAGKEVPADMQSRLVDAESVLRADRDVELRTLREAAARASGLGEQAIRQLLDDIRSIDRIVGAER